MFSRQRRQEQEEVALIQLLTHTHTERELNSIANYQRREIRKLGAHDVHPVS